MNVPNFFVFFGFPDVFLVPIFLGYVDHLFCRSILRLGSVLDCITLLSSTRLIFLSCLCCCKRGIVAQQ